MHNWTFYREGSGTERKKKSQRKNREIRIGLSPINKTKRSQSGPSKRRWGVEGSAGFLTYTWCVEWLQAGCQGVQGWGTMGRGVGGRPWLVHWEGLAVPPVRMGVGGDWGGHWEPRGIRSWPKPTHTYSTYYSSHHTPLPMASAPTSSTRAPYPMAGCPPSLLAAPQRTVLCLHPRDLQERRKGAGRDGRMKGRTWEGWREGRGCQLNGQRQASIITGTVKGSYRASHIKSILGGSAVQTRQ